MKDIISYVLFNDRPKYWKLIPLIYMANRLLKPHLVMRWQVALNSLETPGWTFLDRMSRRPGSGLEVRVVEREHRNHEAAAWRMLPYWEPDIRHIFLRDSDSLPCTYELQAEKVFWGSGLWIHGMRAHYHHVDDMIASVTIYNCEKLRPHGPKDYEEFAKYGAEHDWSHWAEQKCMREWFTPFRKHMLISVTNGGKPSPNHPVFGLPHFYPDEAYEKADISHANPEMLKLCDEISLFPSGQIYTTTPEKHGEKVMGRWDKVIGVRIQPDIILERALAIEGEATAAVKKIFDEDPELKLAFWTP